MGYTEFHGEAQSNTEKKNNNSQQVKKSLGGCDLSPFYNLRSFKPNSQ